VIIVAQLPPNPADLGQDSASPTEPLDPPFAFMKMPDAKLPPVFLMQTKPAIADLDPLDPGLDPMALDRKMADLKRMRAARMLLVSRPAPDKFSLFGWKPSFFFNRPEVGTDPPVDPAELKRLLGEASRQGAIDPGEIKKLFSAAVEEGGIDPRALKKMLARAQWQDGGNVRFVVQKGLPPGMKRPFDEDLDQQKRVMEKQQDGQEPDGKPFSGPDPRF
jgi:hypothetical protein